MSFLKSYYVSGTQLNTLHTLSHVILPQCYEETHAIIIISSSQMINNQNICHKTEILLYKYETILTIYIIAPHHNTMLYQAFIIQKFCIFLIHNYQKFFPSFFTDQKKNVFIVPIFFFFSLLIIKKGLILCLAVSVSKACNS